MLRFLSFRPSGINTDIARIFHRGESELPVHDPSTSLERIDEGTQAQEQAQTPRELFPPVSPNNRTDEGTTGFKSNMNVSFDPRQATVNCTCGLSFLSSFRRRRSKN